MTLYQPYVGVFGGTPIIVRDECAVYECRQVRFPKSKRKRIRKKWRKDRSNWRSVFIRDDNFEIGGRYYVGARTYAALRAEFGL